MRYHTTLTLHQDNKKRKENPLAHRIPQRSALRSMILTEGYESATSIGVSICAKDESREEEGKNACTTIRSIVGYARRTEPRVMVPYR